MKRFLLLILVSLSTAYFGYAQVTTSSMSGTIKDSKEDLIGASIKATHLPTGTVYGASTNSEGRLIIGGMQAGGPYKVEVSYIGYQSQAFNDVFLKLGEPFVLNLTLNATGTDLREVVVTATDPNSILNANKSGATTNISRAQIQALPTITRSVNDLTRLTPQANGTAVGGGNYRSNNFTVDGANFNNQFGIGQNIPANGSPISLDALEQISINVTPFDVRQTGFTGAAINAVTRSGTNKFTGTAFYLFRDEDQQGGRVNGQDIIKQRFDQKQYGVSFGGPIIKNKLFFFVNGEFNKVTQPGQTKVASTLANPYVAGNSNNVARPSADFLNGVRSLLINRYGYDPGVYEGYDNKSNNDKFFARLDWNIAKNHRFNIRYSQVESKTPSFLSTSTTGTNFNYSNSRTSSFALHFSNSNYFQDQNLYAGTAELNSTFGSRITNVARVAYAHQNDPRSSESAVFPFVDILEAGNPLTSFGYEPFTFGNLRDVETYTYTDELGLSAGKHHLTLGAQYETSLTQNGFQRFGTSLYQFSSWNDFVNNAKPANFAITYPLTADGSQAFPSFKFSQFSVYLQDEFNVTEKFKLTAGLRLENPAYPGVAEVKTHPLVAALSFNGGEKIDTGVLPETQMMFSPRLGFNWDVKGDRSLQVRGGSGIFTGRIPYVWIVAQSGDAGLLQFTQAYNGTANTPGVFNPNPAAYIPTTKPTPGSAIPSSISAMSPDLKFPQTWKSSLAFDFKLPAGIVATLEGIYNRDINAVYARNANLVDPTPLGNAGYPDNRALYPAASGSKFINKLTSSGQVTPTATGNFNAIVMDNVDNGKSNYWSVSAQLTKQFNRSLSGMLAYTASGAKTYGDGAGDQILNLWSIPPTVGNSNIPTLGYTSNVLPNRVIASLNYRKEFLQNLATSVSLFYEGAIQNRYSYTYGGDFNRDLQNNDLIYVPANPSEITFEPIPAGTSGYRAAGYTAQEQSDIFFAFIEQDDYLKSRKGQYAERNGAKLPWRNQVDLRFSQEVFKNGKNRNSFEFTADVFNIGNLINSDWGTIDFARNSGILIPRNASGSSTVNGVTTPVMSSTQRPIFRMAAANGDIVRDSFGTTQTISSTYYAQFGFRYRFQ